jgi:competence protein ComEA
VLVAGIGFWQWQRSSAPYVVEEDAEAPNSIMETSEGIKKANSVESIIVHIAGAVLKPGLLKIPATFRLGDAIEKAGGAVEQADLNHLNLAIILEDGARYYIPTLEESIQQVTSTKVPNPVENGKLDLNSAQLTDLTDLPQIGESRAKAILEYREKQGRFHSTDEIMKVPGIGEGIYAVIRDQITVR